MQGEQYVPRGYRDPMPQTSDKTPDERMKGAPPNLFPVRSDELTTGTIRGNLSEMLGGIPEMTKRQIGMPD